MRWKFTQSTVLSSAVMQWPFGVAICVGSVQVRCGCGAGSTGVVRYINVLLLPTVYTYTLPAHANVILAYPPLSQIESRKCTTYSPT